MRLVTPSRPAADAKPGCGRPDEPPASDASTATTPDGFAWTAPPGGTRYASNTTSMVRSRLILVLLEPLKRGEQAIVPITWNRPRLLRPERLALAARHPEPLAPATSAQHRAGEHHPLEINIHLCDGLLLGRSGLAFR